MAGVRCVGLWPSPRTVASLGAQSCICQAHKRQSQGTACPQEAGEGEGSPVWQSHVPKSLLCATVKVKTVFQKMHPSSRCTMYWLIMSNKSQKKNSCVILS